MAPEIWMLLREVGAFLQWIWRFAPIPAILWLLCFLWPVIGEVEDDPGLPERK